MSLSVGVFLKRSEGMLEAALEQKTVTHCVSYLFDGGVLCMLQYLSYVSIVFSVTSYSSNR